MNSRVTALLVMIISWHGVAKADSVAFFESPKKARVILNNGKTADADFIWDILSIEPATSGLKQSKAFEASHGEFKVVCNRANTTPKPVTSCTIGFAEVALGGVVSISKAENRITGIFSDQISNRFKLAEALVKSPDEALTVCSVCGESGAGLPFSITWKK